MTDAIPLHVLTSFKTFPRRNVNNFKEIETFEPEEFKHMTSGLKISHALGLIPFKFDKKFKILSSINKPVQKWICITQFLVCNMYMGYLFCYWIFTLYHENRKSPKRISLQYMFWASCPSFVIHWNHFLHFGHHHLLINSFLYVHQQLRRTTDVRWTDPDSGGFNRFLKIVRFFGICITAMNLLALIGKPMTPHLLTSLVLKITIVPKWVVYPMTIIQGYILIVNWTTIYAKLSQISTYLQVILECLNNLKNRNIHGIQTWKLCKEFRKMQCLQSHFDQLHCQFLIHLEVVLIITVVLGILAGVKVEGAQGIRPLFAASAGLAVLLFLWIKMAYVNDVSSEVLYKWKVQEGLTNHARLWTLKFFRSTLPVRIRLGTFFYADRQLVLTILAIIINNTATLLLTN